MKNNIVLILQIGLFLITGIRFLDIPDFIDNTFIIISLLSILISLFLLICREETNSSLKKQYFRISTLFITGFFIVHFQFYVDILLENHLKFDADLIINQRFVSTAMLISVLALQAFIIGYILRANHKDQVLSNNNSENSFFSQKILSLTGLKCFSWIVFIAFFFYADKNYFAGGYGSIDLGTQATYLETILIDLIIAYCIVHSYNLLNQGYNNPSFISFIKGLDRSILILSGLYLILVLLSGDRGPIFQIGIAFFCGYVFVGKFKLKMKTYLILFSVGVFIISSLGIIRSLNKDSFVEKVVEISKIRNEHISSHSVSPSTFELSISIRTMHAAVAYVNEKDFMYGKVQFFQIISMLPGLGQIYKGIAYEEPGEFSSAIILTKYILGPEPSHGLGTTCVADIYIDLGVMGVVIVFFLFGYFIRYLEVASYSSSIPSLFTWIMIFVFTSKAVYIGRSPIIAVFKESIFIYILICLLVLFFFRKKTF